MPPIRHPRKRWVVPRAPEVKHIQGPASLSQGQGTVEYAILIASIGVVLIVAMVFLGGKIQDLFIGGDADSPLFRPPAAVCDANYSGACIPSPPPNLNCDDLRALGIRGEVRIVGQDPHGLDPDGDGIACN